jgi:hypothetical protein
MLVPSPAHPRKRPPTEEALPSAFLCGQRELQPFLCNPEPTAPFFDCPGMTDEIYDCPCSLFVERPTPCARTYANQLAEDSREVALIAEAARQGHIR